MRNPKSQPTRSTANQLEALQLTFSLPSRHHHFKLTMSDAGSNAGLDEAAIARKQQLAVDLARAKDAGWNNPIPFNYETVVGGEVVPDETRDNASWLADAATYVWDDDFGDVGEANPDLEKMLFEDQNVQRVGHSIKALSFEVDTAGPEKVAPVRNVRRPNSCMHFTAHLSSSRTLVFTRSCSIM
jgi:hypothetical protein